MVSIDVHSPSTRIGSLAIADGCFLGRGGLHQEGFGEGDLYWHEGNLLSFRLMTFIGEERRKEESFG